MDATARSLLIKSLSTPLDLNAWISFWQSALNNRLSTSNRFLSLDYGSGLTPAILIRLLLLKRALLSLIANALETVGGSDTLNTLNGSINQQIETALSVIEDENLRNMLLTGLTGTMATTGTSEELAAAPQVNTFDLIQAYINSKTNQNNLWNQIEPLLPEGYTIENPDTINLLKQLENEQNE
jgi:hypothetical protein